jgi:mRNA-degrading endonuclease RelE of RelBE toxin-antitoxin system
VRSRTTKRFRKQLAALPEEVQQQAKQAYQQFKRDPWHSSLRFKQVHPSQAIYSVRVTKGYRAVGKRDEQGMLWYWIGSHADYDQLLKRP